MSVQSLIAYIQALFINISYGMQFRPRLETAAPQ